MSKANLSIIGQTFNRLTIVSFAEMRKNVAFFNCLCQCGTEKVMAGWAVKRGSIKSCGCFNKERLSETHTKHGQSRKDNRLYCIWENMRQRCLNKNAPGYKNYGGRGITICDEWSDFGSFEGWALANGYADNLTLDRRENSGNYEPINCRWITNLEQQANKRDSLKITFNGQTLIASEWARRSGHSKGKIGYWYKTNKPLGQLLSTV